MGKAVKNVRELYRSCGFQFKEPCNKEKRTWKENSQRLNFLKNVYVMKVWYYNNFL